jgi:hypothetical protein
MFADSTSSSAALARQRKRLPKALFLADTMVGSNRDRFRAATLEVFHVVDRSTTTTISIYQYGAVSDQNLEAETDDRLAQESIRMTRHTMLVCLLFKVPALES